MSGTEFGLALSVFLACAVEAVEALTSVLAGFVVQGPLARVPENTLKFAVGVMLTSFGTFWGAEGAGAHWPGGDGALLVLVPVVLVFAISMVLALRRGAGVKLADGRAVRA